MENPFIERTIFSISVPFIYSALNIGIKYFYPIINKKTNHIVIMSTIGALKGATIDYKNDFGYIESSAHEGMKSFIKFASRLYCSSYIENTYEINNYGSKAICIGLGSFASSVYGSGLKHITHHIYKSILTIPSNLMADILRKALEPQYSYATSNDPDEKIYETLSREYDFLASNIVHSLTIGTGKEIVGFLLDLVTGHNHPLNDNIGLNLIINICPTDKKDYPEETLINQTCHRFELTHYDHYE